MVVGRITRLSEEAAKETRRRIREDRKRVSAQLWPVLEYLAEHLLDDALQVATMWAACGHGLSATVPAGPGTHSRRPGVEDHST